MIKFENTEVMCWEAAIRGMRNPMNSWEKSDSGNGCDEKQCKNCGFKQEWCGNSPEYIIGPNDLDLMKRLCKAGTDHRKFMRMITVYVDITAPLYWWKEFDTYKVGSVANSCSTMHKIHAKGFTLEDFSCEHLLSSANDKKCVIEDIYDSYYELDPTDILDRIIDMLNKCRILFLETKDKKYWWQMIQLLPSSYNQKRTVMLNYEVLANIYKSRKNHKLDEWAEHPVDKINTTTSDDIIKGDFGPHYVDGIREYFGFCDWIKTLPYSELITGEEEEEK